MAKFSVDPDKDFPVIPEGTYEVMVADAELKKSQSGDHPYIEVKMTILEGEFAKFNIWDRLSLSPKAQFRLSNFCKACALIGADASGLQELDTNDLSGQVLIVTGALEEWQGQKRFRPQRYEMHPKVAESIEKELENKTGENAKDAKDEKKEEKPSSEAKPENKGSKGIVQPRVSI